MYAGKTGCIYRYKKYLFYIRKKVSGAGSIILFLLPDKRLSPEFGA